VTTALVTGAAGQDGVYLSRHLAATGASVLAGVRDLDDPRVLAYLRAPGIEVVPLDVTDTAAVAALLRRRHIDEVYNLAALSSVARSWQAPRQTAAVNADAVEGMLAAIRHIRPATRFFQASSVQAGTSSPYAASKLTAEALVAEARTRGVFAVAGRLANHESPLRPPTFVVRRIARAAALGQQLALGDLSVRRDWGHAADHVRAMPLLLRAAEPADADICTGTMVTLDGVVAAAFAAAGRAVDVVLDPAQARPSDPQSVGGDAAAIRALGWAPSYTLAGMLAEMVAVERQRAESGVEHDARYVTITAAR
jgi:GDPmannose 4,6-dehydratase